MPEPADLEDELRQAMYSLKEASHPTMSELEMLAEKGTQLDLDELNEELDETEAAMYRGKVNSYISYAKYTIIDLIAAVEILRTVF